MSVLKKNIYKINLFTSNIKVLFHKFDFIYFFKKFILLIKNIYLIKNFRKPDHYLLEPFYPFLDRPESIEYSQRWDLFLVSNSGDSSLLIYKNVKKNGYKLKLLNFTQCKKSLFYVHKSIFIKNDSFVISVSRNCSTLVGFEIVKKNARDFSIFLKKKWELINENNGLKYPSSLAYDPNQKIIVVSNREELGLTFFSLKDKPILEFSLNESFFESFGLASPHDVNFSADHKFLIVTHKKYTSMNLKKISQIKMNSGISIFKTKNLYKDPFKCVPFLIHKDGSESIHSISFNPIDNNIIACTNEYKGIEIYRLDLKNKRLLLKDRIKIFQIGQGAKGICFTRDGKFIVITTEMNEILFYDYKKYLKD